MLGGSVGALAPAVPLSVIAETGLAVCSQVGRSELLFVVFTVFAADILGMNTVYQMAVDIKKLERADTIATIPKAGVTLGSVRRFIIN